MPAGFETFDHFSTATRTATSIKSIDLTQKTYQSAAVIVSRGKQQVEQVWAFTGARHARRELLPSDILKRQLDIIVPRGTTPSQQAAFAEIVSYGRSLKVNVRILER